MISLITALALLAAPLDASPNNDAHRALIRSQASAPATDRLLWNDVPIAITLPVGREVVMRLPAASEVGVPPELTGKLRVELVKHVLLLKATESFPAARLALRTLSGNHVYLLDIAATSSANSVQFELIDPALQLRPIAANALLSASGPEGDVRMALTRFASREFYAPERLRGGLSAVRLKVEPQQVEIYRGAVVRATPRAAWSYRRHYVTAIELRNLTPDSRELDPRMLRGDWLTATFQHGVLHPAGQDGELTMLYVVSNRPFGDTL